MQITLPELAMYLKAQKTCQPTIFSLFKNDSNISSMFWEKALPPFVKQATSWRWAFAQNIKVLFVSFRLWEILYVYAHERLCRVSGFPTLHIFGEWNHAPWFFYVKYVWAIFRTQLPMQSMAYNNGHQSWKRKNPNPQKMWKETNNFTSSRDCTLFEYSLILVKVSRRFPVASTVDEAEPSFGGTYIGGSACNLA